jgi:pyruvate/2-oxoglutarate dehydrogenase complex dihydrolipoamide dehydrogenase (E3) component
VAGRICCSRWIGVSNTAETGLDKAGIETHERGYIRVDDQLRTNVAGIWVPGDANGRGAFTHASYNGYEIVAANLLDQGTAPPDRAHSGLRAAHRPASGTGRAERAVGAWRHQSLPGTMPMSYVGRAREGSATQNSMSVLVDAQNARDSRRGVPGTT